MTTANKINKLTTQEVRLIKAMLRRPEFKTDQQILAYFTRPARTINHARIAEIRTEVRRKGIAPASDSELDEFLRDWGQTDTDTGLHLQDDELLIKSREAMLLAVQSYNNPTAYFRSEVFIVLAIIAWTYLFHAYYKTQGVDYRFRIKTKGQSNDVMRTKHGAERYWGLIQCLKAPECPDIEEGAKRNLEFLIDIRHEIEHRMTKRIDNTLSAKMQACCLNFNRNLKKWFGERYGLDRELSFALQFSSIDIEQTKALAADSDLAPNIEAVRTSIEDQLTDHQYNDPHYAYRVRFVRKIVDKKSQADVSVEFISHTSDHDGQTDNIYIKEVDRNLYRPGRVVKIMNDEGYTNFKIKQHTDLWRRTKAKDPAKGFGKMTLSDGWRWYDRWVEFVRKYCIDKNY